MSDRDRYTSWPCAVGGCDELVYMRGSHPQKNKITHAICTEHVFQFLASSEDVEKRLIEHFGLTDVETIVLSQGNMSAVPLRLFEKATFRKA